jgi:hypothetical protein
MREQCAATSGKVNSRYRCVCMGMAAAVTFVLDDHGSIPGSRRSSLLRYHIETNSVTRTVSYSRVPECLNP